MAADDERARRIKASYKAAKAKDQAAVTWKRIADHVGVSERSAVEWQKTGALKHSNAVAFAEFLNKYIEVDADWLWRGPKGETPDLMAALPNHNGSSQRTQLDAIEGKLDEVLAMLRRREGDGPQAPADELLQPPVVPKPRTGTSRRARKRPAAGSG